MARTVLARTAHPLLLLSVAGVFAAATHRGWDRGLVTVVFQLAVISYLVALEHLIPYKRSWNPDRREWRAYGAYFLLTALGAGLGQALVLSAVGAVAEPNSPFPLWAEIPAALLLGSLAGYAVHRLGHTNRWLWRLHGIHHRPEKVNVGNNGVNHVADVLLTQGCVQLALALVGFSETAVFGVGLFVVAQGYFVHANVAVGIGALNHVFTSPEQHRLHHSTDLAEAGHYSSDVALWDHAFGSFTWRPDREPAAVGLEDPASFPPTGAVLASLAHPFRRTAKPGRGTG
nr:sterol desaturase family protein [Streptomyces sp. SBT349]